MTDNEIIYLYIEKLAFQETIYELSHSNGADSRMETGLNSLCNYLEGKIRIIDDRLNKNKVNSDYVISQYSEIINNYKIQFNANRPIKDAYKQ